MKHKYQHKNEGLEVTVIAVDLAGAPNDPEWVITLSSGDRLSIHEFIENFESTLDVSPNTNNPTC